MEYGVDSAWLLDHLVKLYLAEGANSRFTRTQALLQKDLGFKRRRLENAVAKLQHAGLLSVERSGMPPRNWYTLNEAAILAL